MVERGALLFAMLLIKMDKSMGFFGILLLFPIIVFSQKVVDNYIVSSVGQYIVLYSDILNEIKVYSDTCQAIVSKTIESAMLAQADKDTIIIPSSTLEDELNRRLLILSKTIGPEEEIAKYFNTDVLQLREDLKNMIEREMKIERVKSKIIAESQVSYVEIQNYYKSLPEDSIPIVESYFVIAAIYRIPHIPPEGIQYAKEKMDIILQKLKEGKSFESLQHIYSEDEGSFADVVEVNIKEVGGPLAYHLKNIPPGGISDVIQLSGSLVLVKVIAKTGDVVSFKTIVIPYYIPYENLLKEKSFLDSLKKEIELGKITFEDAFQKFSHYQPTKNKSGIIINPKNFSSRLTIDDIKTMDPTLLPVVASLEEGQISSPHPTILPDGRKALRIIKILKNVPSHRATPDEDYELFKEILQQKKQEAKILAWFKEKIKNTYFYVTEKWESCFYFLDTKVR